MKRKYFDSIKKHLDNKEFTIITGARQIGKTTLLKQIQEELVAQNIPVVFLNLDRKSILNRLNDNPENIFDFLPQTESRRIVVLIDEVQYLDDPTNFIKLLYDDFAEKIKIVATGSSAFYIDRSFRDSLAGRKKIFELKTLDFEEFLNFKSEDGLLSELKKLRTGAVKTSIYEAQLWLQLEEYAVYGGYPAVVLDNDKESKKERLYELRDSFLKRDILESGIANEEKFYKLCMILAGQIGNMVNVNELANTLQISNATVENYLFVLQKCFHIELIKPFFKNLRKELVKMPKVYFNDPGLRNALLDSFGKLNIRVDKGALFENLIYRRLSENYPSQKIKYWRTTESNEVDFVIEQLPDEGIALEVKFAETEVKPNKYKIFQNAYPKYPLSFRYWGQNDVLL